MSVNFIFLQKPCGKKYDIHNMYVSVTNKIELQLLQQQKAVVTTKLNEKNLLIIFQNPIMGFGSWKFLAYYEKITVRLWTTRVILTRDNDTDTSD